MKQTMALAIAAFVLSAASVSLPGDAGAQVGTMLPGRNLEVGTVIDALDPVSTRSIRVQRDGSTGPGGSPTASLLVTFATNSAQLTDDSRHLLDVVARAMHSDKLQPYGFIVEGHADPRGGHDLNLRLSQARAESVVRYMVEQHGVERSRLRPIGKGDFELANRAEPTAPENRRVTFKTRIE